jgi:hypothetical protein
VLSRKFYPKRRGRRLATALAAFTILAGTAYYAGTALAVHDEGVFELEGNATAGVDAANPANPLAQPPGGDDWAAVFAGTDSAEATSFVNDTTKLGTLAGAGDSILTGGSTKDIYDIGPSWLWKETNVTSVQDKDDIEHAMAAEYKVDKTGGQCGSSGATPECVLLYFGADRFSNSGDSVMGFWFFKQQISTVGPDASGNGTFSGSHTERTATSRGDILVVSDFRAGGKAPSIQVYEWVHSGGSASTHLDQIGGGTNPASCTQAPAEGGKAGKDPIPPVGANDNFCATANQNVVTSPWPFTAKDNSGGTSGAGGATTKFGVAEFMEGGINLTALGLGNECFSTFLAESRSSHSPTSTLSDFTLGGFGECTSGIVTTPQTGGGTTLTSTSIGTTARVDVRDHAEITVGGTTNAFDGNVKFFLCGPLASNTTTNCSTGGVQIGAAAGETVSGTAGSASLNSTTATLTSAGRYCWRAEYSGDAAVGVPASKDPSKSVADGGTTSECFVVTPVTPTLTTTASADVTLGDDITDTADLSGTAKLPGTDGKGPGGTIDATAATQDNADGQITWTLNGPDDCDDAGLTLTGSPADVDGDGTYGPVSATPTAIGVYTFVASYDGSSPNTLGAGPSGCPPSETDGDEEVTVGGTSSLATTQDWLPNDTATLTGDTNLTGTLTFQLYTGSDCDATGSAVSGQFYSVDVTDAASGSPFSTDNTTSFLEADSGSYSWLVTYTDDHLSSPDPTCETTTITIDDTP